MDAQLVETIVDQVMRRLMAGGAGSMAAPSASVVLAESDLITDDIRAGRVVVGVSNRHIHLTDEHVEILFGPGARLTPLRPLHQPGEFASQQQVTLVGPTGRSLGPVRVLGPTRRASQVELSLTDCYALGFKHMPPIRPSGDHRGSAGITMVGPAGAVTLKSGVIRANRHIHLNTLQAAAMGLRDGDLVDVRVDGERPSILLGCQVRAHDAFRAEMHLDTDDANATGIRTGQMVQILLSRRGADLQVCDSAPVAPGAQTRR